MFIEGKRCYSFDCMGTSVVSMENAWKDFESNWFCKGFQMHWDPEKALVTPTQRGQNLGR